MPDRPPRVSLVLTVRDEADGVPALLAALRAQTLRPDEIVVVDGGSRDGTPDRLEELGADLPLTLLRAPGAGIAEGRNIAIREAAHEIIAVTDAGTDFGPGWLRALIEPFSEPGVDVVSGFSVPGGRTWFERGLAAVITPGIWEIDPPRFLPSSRSVAFRRAAWRSAGGYPEWLTHCEDLVFDMAMRDAGARFAFAPAAEVRWHARPSLRRFARQYFLYARGDGHAHLFGRRHAARYATYAFSAAALAVAPRRPGALLVLVAGGAVYLRRFHTRIARNRRDEAPAARAAMHLLVPVIVVTGDVAKMCGYPVGLWQRFRAGGPGGLARRFARVSPPGDPGS